LNEKIIKNGCYLKFKTKSKVTYLIKCDKVIKSYGGYDIESLCYRCSNLNLEGRHRYFFVPEGKCKYLEVLTEEEFQAELL
jgi:hypothetical protein